MKKNKARTIKSRLIKDTLKSLGPNEARQIENQMKISARLDDLMQSKSISKSQLAIMLGKNPSEITKWLSGTHNFTIDTLSILEVALGESFLFSEERRELPDHAHELTSDLHDVQFYRNRITGDFHNSAVKVYWAGSFNCETKISIKKQQTGRVRRMYEEPSTITVREEFHLLGEK